MAKAAGRAHQEEILRLQRSTVDNGKRLKREVAEIKSQLQELAMDLPDTEAIAAQPE
eukprot:CAMPEP_0194050292 /NCGR_PEP_ID=MMETSP0009_2-20130614/34454_1 /TAXON_ID=210454 /ORGANISM="Grammatophora oceanica, Strain CCMP 410" /LENGTH=56 /DNA_ID=CAMNT_0038696835 /DNA_START=1 /DNA_END=171 /DNA_ORIENTATION=-